MTTLPSLTPAKTFVYALLSVLTMLLAIYMRLLWHYGDKAHLGMSGLFILALGILLWERRRSIKFAPSRTGVVLGGFGCTLVVGISSVLLMQQGIQDSTLHEIRLPITLLRSLPVLIAISLAVLASGISGLRQFWREEVLLLALGLPGIIALFIADISPLTAVFSTGLLHLGGYDALREGTLITLPGGSVLVYYGCSGMEAISYLLGLSILFLILFPVSGLKRYITPAIGIIIGFTINGVRVSLMAILWAAQDIERFDYWHTGEGSLIFALVSVLIFSTFYLGAIHHLEKRQTH